MQHRLSSVNAKLEIGRSKGVESENKMAREDFLGMPVSILGSNRQIFPTQTSTVCFI